MLRQLVSMAGDFSMEATAAGTNCRIDPVAAGIVFRSDVPRHLIVGVDLSRSCRLPVGEALARIEQIDLHPLTEMARHWSRDRQEVFFHDPLSAALIFRPELCPVTTGTVSISLTGDAGPRGATKLSPGDGRVFVATGVDAPAFLDEFFGVANRRPETL